MPQDEELEVLGGGRAAHQQDQSEYLQEDQIQQAKRHGGDHAQPSTTADHPLVSDRGPSCGPRTLAEQHWRGGGSWELW
jgi:hypothetical protein